MFQAQTAKKSVFSSLRSLFVSESFCYQDINKHVKEVSQVDFLRQYLPFLSILSDHKTIITKNHTLIRVLKITGVDSSNLSEDDKQGYKNIRNNFFSFLNTEIRLNFYTIRRQLADVENEETLFESKYANRISKTWHSQFQNSFVSETFLVISRNFPNLGKNLEQFSANVNAARKEFDFTISQAKALLTKFAPIDLDNGAVANPSTKTH